MASSGRSKQIIVEHFGCKVKHEEVYANEYQADFSGRSKLNESRYLYNKERNMRALRKGHRKRFATRVA